MEDEGFFEEDEATEDIVAAFEHGEKGVTARPALPLFHFVGESLNEGCYSLVTAPTINNQLARWMGGGAANVGSPSGGRLATNV